MLSVPSDTMSDKKNWKEKLGPFAKRKKKGINNQIMKLRVCLIPSLYFKILFNIKLLMD